jgi:hypothetical protein
LRGCDPLAASNIAEASLHVRTTQFRNDLLDTMSLLLI